MASSKSYSLKVSLNGPRKDGGDGSKEKGDEEACAQQLDTTMRESMGGGDEKARKPVLTHLNADTTWLLSLPYPEFYSKSKSDGNGAERNADERVDGKRERNMKRKKYFHILIDPWLKGGQSDIAGWFSQQWHVVKSCVETYPELQELIRGVGDAGDVEGEGLDRAGDEGEKERMGDDGVDLVVISHEFTDHMHKETLLGLPRDIPVMATSKAAGIIRSWKHFDVVKDIERFDGDWRNTCLSKMGLDGDWLGVSRVAYAGVDLLYYHSAILLTFSASPSSPPQGVIYTPHGISPENIAPMTTAEPRIDTLALLHGLQDIALPMGAQLNRGAHNGLRIQRMVGARWWVGTHDEVKKGGGLVSYFLRRQKITLKEAMEREAKIAGDTGEQRALEGVRFVELESGKSLVLD